MKFLYIKVIEAKEVVSRPGFQVTVPEVVLKLNSSDVAKKSTGFKVGTSWWEKNFRFPCRYPTRDFVSVELREKGFHVIRSDWLGEIQIQLKDYDDGKVHQRWYRLSKAVWKKHRNPPKGCLHLKIQVLNNITEKPFTTRPVERVMTYEEWIDWQENQYAKKMFDPSNMSSYPLYDSHDDSNKDHWRASSKRSVISPLSSMSSLEDDSTGSAHGDEAGAEKVVQSPSKDRSSKKEKSSTSSSKKTSSSSSSGAGGANNNNKKKRTPRGPKEGLLIDLSDAVPPPEHNNNNNNSNNPFSSSSTEEDAGRVLDQLKRLSLSSSLNSSTGTLSNSSNSNNYMMNHQASSYYPPYAGACSVQSSSASNLNSSSKGNPFLEDGEVLPSSIVASGRFA